MKMTQEQAKETLDAVTVWPIAINRLCQKDLLGKDIPYAAELVYPSGLRETVTLERADEILRAMKARQPVKAFNPKNQALLDAFAQDAVKNIEQIASDAVAGAWWRNFITGESAKPQAKAPAKKPVPTPVTLGKKRKINVEDA